MALLWTEDYNLLKIPKHVKEKRSIPMTRSNLDKFLLLTGVNDKDNEGQSPRNAYAHTKRITTSSTC